MNVYFLYSPKSREYKLHNFLSETDNSSYRLATWKIYFIFSFILTDNMGLITHAKVHIFRRLSVVVITEKT